MTERLYYVITEGIKANPSIHGTTVVVEGNLGGGSSSGGSTGGTRGAPVTSRTDLASNKAAMPKMTNVIQEVQDWWTEQLAYDSGSEDEF
jgi:hypothetical protein